MRRKRDAMRENLEKYGEVIAGSILLSLGIWLFVTPNGLNFGGVIGTSQIIEVFVRKLLPIPKSMNIVGIINFMINIPLFIMGYRILNREFCIKTGMSVVVQTITLSILPNLTHPVMPDMLSNCIFGAIMCGVGVGLALKGSGSTGGIDIAGVCLSKTKPGFSVGKLSTIVNAVILTCCAFIFDLQTTLYSILLVIVFTIRTSM